MGFQDGAEVGNTKLKYFHRGKKSIHSPAPPPPVGKSVQIFYYVKIRIEYRN